MQKIIPFFLLSIFSFTSCAQSEVVNTVNSIVVDLDQTTPAKYTIVDTIRLETRDDALIGEHPRACANDKYFVVWDAAKIVVFHKNGEIKTVFDPKGRSRKEVTSLFALNVTNDYIEVPDYSRIVRYNFDGNFIKAIKLPETTYDYTFFEELLLIDFQSYSEKALRIYGNKNKLIKDTIESICARSNFAATTKFSVDKGILYYLPSFRNEVFSVDKNANITTAYRFDFGNHWATKEEHEKIDNDSHLLNRYLNDNEKIAYLTFRKNNEWLKLNFSISEEKYNWFYNEKTHEQYIADSSVPILGKTQLGLDGDKFISFYDAFSYLETFGDDGITTEDSNPIIITYKLD